YEGRGPEESLVKAEVIEASGKTVLPGLIDVHVHIGAPGGLYSDPKDFSTEHIAERALAQYLYSGITTVKSVGDQLDASLALRKRIRDGVSARRRAVHQRAALHRAGRPRHGIFLVALGSGKSVGRGAVRPHPEQS